MKIKNGGGGGGEIMATVTPEQRIADRIHANDLLLKQLQLFQERSEKCGELGDLVDCAYAMSDLAKAISYRKVD